MGAIFLPFKNSRTVCNRTQLLRPIFSEFTPKRNIKMSFLSLNSFTPNSPSKERGQIQVIFGPMFSGKSTELLRRIRRYKIAKRECLVIKYSKDDRFSDDCMATHDKQLIPAVKATKLFNLKCLDKYSVIGVDEGQFFPDVVEFSEEMANLGKTVIVAALDGTFERKPFGRILELVPIAESVVKLNAVCNNCFREAAYTKRIGLETAIEVIGGSDKYMAMCRQCFQLSPTKVIPKVENVRSPFKNVSNKENFAIAKNNVARKVF